MTSPSYPAALDALANPGATTETDDAGFELDVVVARLQNCIMAIEGKLGIGVGGPSAAGVLRRTAGTTSGWGQVATGDIAAGATSQNNWISIPSVAALNTPSNTDIPGSQLSLTTTGGDVVEIIMLSVFSAVAGTVVYVAFSIDGAPGVGDQPIVCGVANSQTMLCAVYRHTGAALGATAHNFRPLWRNVSNTVALTAGYHLVVELKK